MKKLIAVLMALCILIIPAAAVSADGELYEIFESDTAPVMINVASDHDILIGNSSSVAEVPTPEKLLEIEKDILIRQEKSDLLDAPIKVEIDEANACVHIFVEMDDTNPALNEAMTSFVKEVQYIYAETVQVHKNEPIDQALLNRLQAIKQDICARFERAKLDTTIGIQIDANNGYVILTVDLETENEKTNEAVGALAKEIQLDYEGEVEVRQHNIVLVTDINIVEDIYKTVLPSIDGKKDMIGIETTGMTLYSYSKPSNMPTVLISLSVLMVIALGCFLFFKNRQTSQASVTNTGHVVSTSNDLSDKTIEDSVRKSEIKPSAAFDKKMRDMIDNGFEK
ncbi:MAG: hypothetical protein IKR78_03355 [Dehalococcoidales bacterium]|nr:hypothetical protein [Dehalococcoidales bacterium]